MYNCTPLGSMIRTIVSKFLCYLFFWHECSPYHISLLSLCTFKLAYNCTSVYINLQCNIFSVPTDPDPFVHKPGEGPSSAELTGEHSDDDQSSSSKQKKKAAKPTSMAKKGTPQQAKVNGKKEVLLKVFTACICACMLE